MTAKNTEKTLAQALLEAQAEFPEIPKDKGNPHFKSRYSSLDAIQSACFPALHKHGILPLYNTIQDSGEIIVIFELIHAATGEKRETALKMGAPSDVQKLGSLITYLRRYACTAGLGVCSDEDDDGNAASKGGNGNGGKQQAPQQQTPPPARAATSSVLSDEQKRTQELSKAGEVWKYEMEKPKNATGEQQVAELNALAKGQGAIRKVDTRENKTFYVWASADPVLELKQWEISKPKSLAAELDQDYEEFANGVRSEA